MVMASARHLHTAEMGTDLAADRREEMMALSAGISPADSPTADSTAEQSSASGLDGLVRVLEAFRELDPDLPIQYAVSFLTIARADDGGISVGELAKRLGIAQSSASRNIAALSAWHSFGKPGLDLVESREDPRERRRKIVTLTSKGAALALRLEGIWADGR